jgi:hypothetical protein
MGKEAGNDGTRRSLRKLAGYGSAGTVSKALHPQAVGRLVLSTLVEMHEITEEEADCIRNASLYWCERKLLLIAANP